MNVTAVVVAHDGAPHLRTTLAALAAQTRPADAVVGVDAGSRDGAAEVLRERLGSANVTAARTPGGFGGAVRRAVEALVPAGQGAEHEWLWLLADDSAPAPDALAELLAAVERAPSVAVAGCKQLDADEPRRLLDVGLSVSRWAERLALIDIDEQDQGQHDARSDVFAVNSAGMLVRRDVWEQLGGFDPALPASGDDIDLCWRARLAGHRVVVVPSARLYRVDRPEAAGAAFAARRAEVYSRLKHAPWWQLPFQAVGALLGGLWQLLAGIVLKEPGLGMARLGASLAGLGALGHLVRGRRRAARTRKVSRSVPLALTTSRSEIWAHRRALLESTAAETDSVIGDGTGSAEGMSEPTGDSQHDFAALAVAARGWAGTGALVVAGVALLASALAFLPLLGADAASGGALLPVSPDLSDIVANATAWWAQIGAGEPGHGDPFDAVLVLLGALGLGETNRAVVIALLIAAPAAAIGAWAFAAAFTGHRAPRVLAALVWASAPALLSALAEGRLGAAVAHAALPWAALGMLRAVGGARVRGTLGAHHVPRPGSGGTPSWTAAAAGGLALAVATAGSPSLLVLAAVLVAAASLALRARARTLWWSLVPSAALALPVWTAAPEDPRAWITDPGLPLPYGAPEPWQLVLGQPSWFEPGAPLAGLASLPAGVPWSLVAALALGVPVLAAAAAAAVLLTGRRGAAARSFLAAAVVSFAFAWGISRLPTAVAGDSLAAPFAGPAVGAGVLALLAAGALGADRLLEYRREAAARPSSGDARPRLGTAATAVAAVLVALGPVAALAHWGAAGLMPAAPVAGALGPEVLVSPARERTLPATASDLGEGLQQTRTLVLRSTDAGGFSAALMRGGGTTADALSATAAASGVVGPWGSERVADDDGADAAVREAVATIAAAQGVDPGERLEQLAVGFVVLQERNGADASTAARIDAVPGLVAVGRTEAGWLWRVTPRSGTAADGLAIAHRARIVDAAGATVAFVPSGPQRVSSYVPAGTEGRRLVLAERTAPGWSATLDGRPLKASPSGWAQGFVLPAAGGHLDVRYDHPAAVPLAVLAAAVFGVTLLLSVPARARRHATGTGLGPRPPRPGAGPTSAERSAMPRPGRAVPPVSEDQEKEARRDEARV
ncbi:glycosyltransferase family 2 protein [Sinomonas halotolerans]|uniref:Glycosyltransferase family 2 protein n=1 Tax=Sinomonas halotolerans TaxID=1644133 RepID=A0ABU9WUY6_9MICC